MSTALTGVLAEHFAAINAADTDRIVATFAEDAYVNDHRNVFDGTESIRDWVSKEIVGDHVTIDVLDVTDHYGDTVVRGRYEGTYDKDESSRRVRAHALLLRARRQDRQPPDHLQPAARRVKSARPSVGLRRAIHRTSSSRARRFRSRAARSGRCTPTAAADEGNTMLTSSGGRGIRTTAQVLRTWF